MFCIGIQWVVTIIESAVTGEWEKPCASLRKGGVSVSCLGWWSVGRSVSRSLARSLAHSFTHSLIARSLDGVDADSSSEAGAEAFSYFSKAGRPLCLHLCPVLSVLFILFFPKTCPFLPESYHTVPLCLDLNYSHVLSRRGHKNCQCDPRVSRSILRPCVLVSIDECPWFKSAQLRRLSNRSKRK